MQYFVFKLLLGCAECGTRFPLDGPTLSATCPSCHSSIEVTTKQWKPIFELYRDAAQFQLTEGKTRGSALVNGEQQIFIRWGPARPSCVACGNAFPVEAVPAGGDGRLACSCGEAIETFPPPAWLSEAVPQMAQLFGAAREGTPAQMEVVGVGAPASARQPAPATTRPVLFNCSRCGAGLDISAETPRILTCKYCESDLYLPDPLWHALHPVKKRAPFWIAFRD